MLSLSATIKADVRDLEERFSDGLKGRDYFSIHYVPHEEVKPGAELANPYALTAARLDAASLDGIPQGWSEVLSARGMVAKRGGLHPDIAAELVLDEDGWQVFPTGEDLLRALVEAEPPQEAIENTAYLYLLAQFGEVPTAADFEAAADAAAHNGLRMRIQEPEGHWQGVITGITLTVESENGAPKITQSAVIDRYMDK